MKRHCPVLPCRRAGPAGPWPGSGSCRRWLPGRRCGRRRSPSRGRPQALAGGGDQGIERNFPGIDPDRPEGAHGIDDQALAVTLDDLGDGLERIEDAGAGLAVDQRHMADRRIGGQQALDVSGGGRHVLFGLEGAEGPLQDLADLRQALAVGTVDQHQDLAVARHQGADRLPRRRCRCPTTVRRCGCLRRRRSSAGAGRRWR